jgi:hypothetical protein
VGRARRRHGARGKAPDQRAVRAELDRWLGEPSIRARGYRDDFFLKVMAAVRSGDPATLTGVLSRRRGPGAPGGGGSGRAGCRDRAGVTGTVTRFRAQPRSVWLGGSPYRFR